MRPTRYFFIIQLSNARITSICSLYSIQNRMTSEKTDGDTEKADDRKTDECTRCGIAGNRYRLTENFRPYYNYGHSCFLHGAGHQFYKYF